MKRDMEARLARLEDERDLDKLIESYLNLADRRDWVAWSKTFTADAVFEVKDSFGVMRGRKEIYDICTGKMEGTWDRTQHMIVNKDFDVDGDRAVGTANIIFVGVPAGGAPTDYYMMGGRYRWKFARTEVGWRIADAWEEFIWNNGAGPQTIFEAGS